MRAGAGDKHIRPKIGLDKELVFVPEAEAKMREKMK